MSLFRRSLSSANFQSPMARVSSLPHLTQQVSVYRRRMSFWGKKFTEKSPDGTETDGLEVKISPPKTTLETIFALGRRILGKKRSSPPVKDYITPPKFDTQKNNGSLIYQVLIPGARSEDVVFRVIKNIGVVVTDVTKTLARYRYGILFHIGKEWKHQEDYVRDGILTVIFKRVVDDAKMENEEEKK